MIKGIDISHHNINQYKNGVIKFDDINFIIMKSSEGKSYIDNEFKTYMKEINAKNKIYGFYHYARPECNDALSEAMHFCNTIGDLGNNALLALDWEGNALDYSLTWALTWLHFVEMRYHKKPLFYCSASYTVKLAPILANNNGLWVAHYTKASKPSVKVYPSYAIWQYTSTPYDKDVFNGNIQQLNRYIKQHH